MEKVDITKILRLFPKGAVIYSPMCGNVVLESVWPNGVEVKMLESNEKFMFDEYGKWKDGGEVMLLPNGFVNDWSGYNPEIKPGDVVVGADETRPFMFLRYGLHGKPIASCGVNYYKDFVVNNNVTSDIVEWTNDTYLKKATETQEKYIFDNLSKVRKLEALNTKKKEHIERFDINTLQPFDKVVVRNIDSTWTPHFFSERVTLNQVSCIGDNGWYSMCVPYNEDTKELIGTCDQAPEKYAWWTKK